MNKAICFWMLFLVSTLWAAVPEPVITTASVSGAYAIVAGRLESKPSVPVGISVKNGNLMYSTLTDLEGRWGIVILFQNVNFTVQSWSLSEPTDKAQETVGKMKLSQ